MSLRGYDECVLVKKCQSWFVLLIEPTRYIESLVLAFSVFRFKAHVLTNSFQDRLVLLCTFELLHRDRFTIRKCL